MQVVALNNLPEWSLETDYFFETKSRKIVSFKTNEGRLFSVTTVPEVTIWFIQRHQPKNYHFNTF